MLTHVPPDIDPPDPPSELPLILYFDDPSSFPVGDPNDVAEWNSLIHVSGGQFLSVQVAGPVVSLYGATNTGITGVNNSQWFGLQVIEDQSDEVISIEADSFQQCQSLTIVDMDGLQSIPSQAFFVCPVLASVSISGATSIGVSAFEQCTSLISVTTPNVVTIDDRAFIDCTALLAADFPACTAFLGSGTFGSCSSMVSANFPVLVDSGVASAFNVCTNLVTVTMPQLQIGCSSMFTDCQSIVNLSLPQMTIAEGTTGFCRNCTSLETFSAPLCVSIGSIALNGFFQSCNALTDIDLSSCTDFGGTVGDDDIFIDGAGVTMIMTVTITVPVFLQTCDGGNPDGDLADLVAANPGTITINYV